eukprot:jgi/Chrzof1/6273/UNPLg00853.t1
MQCALTFVSSCGAELDASVKTAKALVSPVTQVTRVQIPSLTNFSGHTDLGHTADYVQGSSQTCQDK